MGEIVCRRLVIRRGRRVFVDIAFTIRQALALVGESGSGKSLTLKALLGMLPKGFESEMDCQSDFVPRRGETLAYVPQNPFTALSPLTRIADQWVVGTENAPVMMEAVGLEAALLRRFPPELSGGQLQRVVIAMALSTRPKLLLLDEPTTALDAALRQTVVALLRRLQEELGFRMLFVTHDIATAARLCSEITVIRKGRVMESGETEAVLARPASDYTKALIEANFANREFRH
ncbi:ATP-binding cassette domain-containing protein [Hydrogenimonas sp. SS33]|uniref:ATP-binding cassette domain-containing protein n=1 Tax=Hydrogenimonas leucolamina TaxID=2954236 RepID=UPI00336BBB16